MYLGLEPWTTCEPVSLEVSRPISFLKLHMIPLASCYVQATPLPKDSPPCFCASQSGVLLGGGRQAWL